MSYRRYSAHQYTRSAKVIPTVISESLCIQIMVSKFETPITHTGVDTLMHITEPSLSVNMKLLRHSYTIQQVLIKEPH